MIQRTFDVKSEADLRRLADLRFYSEYAHSKTIFIQLYISRFSAEDAQKVLDASHIALPQAKIVGMSLYGDPYVGLNNEKLMRFNFCFFDESEVTVFDYDGENCSLNEIISDFKKNLSSLADVKGVLLLGSGTTFKASHFMDEVTRGYEDIPFFGSIANINTADVNDQAPFAFGNKMIRNGIVAAIFSGKNLHFYTESLFSWKPIGKEMLVESGEPGIVGDSIIKTIDGLPATQIFKKYLDVEPDAHFVSNICEFPIVVNRNGYLMARVPCGFNEKGEINTMGDVRDGEYIRFSYGKASEILSKTEEASFRMRDFAPQAIFLYACANRAIFLKDCAHEEIDFYAHVVSELVYCHGFSELYRYKGQGGVFNSQLVAIGLREGEEKLQELRKPLIQGISFDNPHKTEKHSHVHRDFSEDYLELPHSVMAEIENWERAPHAGGLHSLHELREQNSQEWIEATNGAGFNRQIGVSIPITERLVTFLEATTNELREATRAANAANEAKSAFLSNMSHEIRSPINAVLGLDEMILRESSEAHIQSYARDIQSSGKSLLSIINDILDFSKIEAGKMEIIPADYDVRSLITNLANMIEVRAVNKGLSFIVNVDTEMPHLLYGDETRIAQCALNILTNAVKYTPSGSVTLTVSSEPGTESNSILLKISVKDTGIGIKEEDLDKLFKPFERIEEGRNRSIEGTGLGMSIVNGLLTKMGTQLEVKSEYGKGSEFSFAIEQNVRDWEKIGTREEAQTALLKEATGYSESFQAPNAKILVVDDTPINLTVVRGLLKNTRIQIDTAQSGEEALKLCAENEYHILFVDHLMPKMDGIGFLAQNWMNADSKNKNTPAIALTANAISGAREMYLQAGFTNYLSKPIDSKKLEEMIAFYLPKDLVLHAGDEGFVAQKAGAWDGTERRASPSASDELFSELFGISVSSALKNCGSKEVLLQAAEDFYDSIDEKANSIEQYATSSDWKNYTILVHALKSSARLIGAETLSELAKSLEAHGTAAQKEEPSSKETHRLIFEKTSELLALYRSYREKLASLLKKTPAQTGGASQKNALSHEKFIEALSALKEVVSAFDFDSADSLVSELDAYSLSEEDELRFKSIKKAVRDVDATAVLALL
ncbi:MAG: response regulator [Treponema sp.]|nr:response regulator [Treponema sp.]